MDLSRKMSRTEYNELSDVDKKERKRLLRIINYNKHCNKNKEKEKERTRKYRQENKEKIQEQKKTYYQNNKEKIQKQKYEYNQTPNGKKVNTLSTWKKNGLQETKEELDIIYDMWLHQELCYSCDIKLSRNGDCCSTQACMDHDHDTHRFRHIICCSCNSADRWMKYFC